MRRAGPLLNLAGSMSTEPTTTPPTPTAPDFTEAVHLFWANNHRQVYFLILAVLLAMVGRYGWGYFSDQREQDVQEEYAKIASAPERLTRFAEEHAGHPLAGVALLRLADNKYAAAEFKGAQAAYAKAAGVLADAALQSRAKLGAAMSQLGAGDTTGAETALKTLSAEAAVARLTRAEAGYQLAALAQSAGRTADARKYAEEVTKLDGAGSWAQRAYLLLAQLPVDKTAPAANPAALLFNPGSK